MFLYKYLSDFNYDLILNNYDNFYLENLDEENFIEVYKVFKRYNFYFVEDVILNYLEIFSLDASELEDNILDLIEELGENYAFIIGNDLRLLEKLI